MLALASVALVASPASATDTRIHVCFSSLPPAVGGSATFIPGPTPNDNRCIVQIVVFTIIPSGPPTTTVSLPQPIGAPVVVTEQVVTNCEPVNNPGAAKPVERCEIQDVTTATQQTQITTIITTQRVRITTTTTTTWNYPQCSPPSVPCETGPLINPVPQGPPQITTQPATPLVQTSTAPGAPIVETNAVTTGTCMKNPGSSNRAKACP